MRRYTAEGLPLLTGDDVTEFADATFPVPAALAQKAQQVATRLRLSDARNSVLCAAVDLGLAILMRRAITEPDEVRVYLASIDAGPEEESPLDS